MASLSLDSIVSALQEEFAIVDLSHTLEENIPFWPTQGRFGHILFETYQFGDVACHYQLIMSEHTGTHMDAPMHFIRSGKAHYAVDQVSLQSVHGRAAMMDVSDLKQRELLGKERIIAWESNHGRLRKGDIVLFNFGWDRFWKLRPDDRVYVKDWPGLGRDAAEYLVQCGIKLVGCDTLAIDAANSSENPAHYALLGNEILIVENLHNLDILSDFSIFMAFPLPIRDGSGSPVRAISFVSKTETGVS